MKSTEMLNKIKTLLDIQVKLEEMKLENGTRVEAESFEKGKEIFIMTDDERVAMPVGEYMLEDGKLLVIEQEGLIADMREVSDEVPQKEDEEGKEITEDLEDKEEDNYEDDGKEAVVEDWAGMEKRIKNLEDAISDIKSRMGEKMEDENSEINDGSLKSRTVKEEFSKEELSEPSVAPIKHSPESKTNKKTNGFLYSQNRVETTMDRVLARLNK
jgi:regulator of replication initiation timing